ncbi:MAG: ATP-binding protein [Candidatus Hodarchaeota archaeon]
MRTLVIISGKGGTGKTTVAGVFASLANATAIGDCDVDAPDFHLILNPSIKTQKDFYGLSKAKIDSERCTACLQCSKICRFDAIQQNGIKIQVNPLMCEGCRACGLVCPEDAIYYVDTVVGEVYLSDSRYAPLSHAQLKIGEENSGKLVGEVREQLKEISRAIKNPLIILDGPPGIGCPVISSITGATAVLIVTEPSVSGGSDMERALALIEHFQMKGFVLLNKADLNPKEVARIRNVCEKRNVEIIGEIPFDETVSRAISNGHTLLEENPNASASLALINAWEVMSSHLKQVIQSSTSNETS